MAKEVRRSNFIISSRSISCRFPGEYKIRYECKSKFVIANFGEKFKLIPRLTTKAISEQNLDTINENYL